MFTMLEWECDRCGTTVPVAAVRQDFNGDRLEWPKVAIKERCAYLTVLCPACGPHLQCIGCADQTSSVQTANI
jgi:hypothetical protein